MILFIQVLSSFPIFLEELGMKIMNKKEFGNMKNEKKADAVTAIDYNFTAIPTKLMILLDNNCKCMLFTLIQLSTVYAEADGYFYRSNELLQLQCGLSKNLVLATVDTLYREGLIDVISFGMGKGKFTNHIKVNFENFKKYESISFEAVLNDPTIRIKTVDYKNHFTPSYLKGKEEGKTLGKRRGKKVNTNIDNIKNTDIYRKEYNIKNNIEDIIKENAKECINASTAMDGVEANVKNDIQIDVEEIKSQTSTALDSVEVDVKEEYNQFKHNYQVLVRGFKDYTSTKEIESKADMFTDWLQSKFNYFKPFGLLSDVEAKQILNELQNAKDSAIAALSTPKPVVTEEFDLSDWI